MRACSTLLFLLILAPWAAAGAGSLPVAIVARARALAPGEPVRITVVSPKPLADAGATFLDQAVFLTPAAGGERWQGWSLVPLDQAHGPAVIEARGRTEDGRPVAGTHAVTIEAREFPQEELRVAPAYVEPPPEVRQRLAREREKLGAVYAERRHPAAVPRAFVRPVPGEPTSVFGTRRVFNGEPRSPHPGLDLRAGNGTPVMSSGDGEVVLAMDLYYSGNTVIVDHGGGLFTLYAHLQQIQVREGQAVAAGERVGLSGATGRVTGPHLHWGAKIGDRPFDPQALLDPTLFR